MTILTREISHEFNTASHTGRIVLWMTKDIY